MPSWQGWTPELWSSMDLAQSETALCRRPLPALAGMRLAPERCARAVGGLRAAAATAL